MRFAALIFAVVMICGVSANAQFRSGSNIRPQRQSNNSDDNTVFKKIYFGGGGGFGFGTGYNYYSLFPIAVYRLTRDFSLGLGFNYSRTNYTYGQSVAYTQYGFMPFARYNISPIFFQAEMDFINSPTVDQSGNPGLVRSYYERFLVGLGYMAQVNQRGSAFNALIMYDLLYKTQGVFQSPIVVRLFFIF